jgi:hypothetical protein
MNYLALFKRLLAAVMPRYKPVRLLVIVLLSAVAIPTGAQLAGAQPAGVQPTTKSPPVISLCRQYQHVKVKKGKSATYVVKNDFWGTNKMCLKNSRRRPNFRVTKTGRNKIGGRVESFPYILRGCSWGVCSPKAKLPAKVKKLHRPEATWHARTKARGVWNAALELWFSKHKLKNGQANGAELMIWLNTRRLPKSSHRTVHIDHTTWYLAHWRTSGHGKTWNYIQFRRVSRRSGVTKLRLGPFIRTAEREHWIRPSYWMLNIEAGFEIWHGGRGLGTKTFSARV